MKNLLSIFLTLLVFLLGGFVHASVDSSFRSQRLGSDLLTVSEDGRTYDGGGRLKTFTTADGDLIQYLYDANNNLTRLTYPDGKQVNYTYNSRNLLATVADWSNRITSYNYDRLGRLTGTTRPNGTSNQIAHDAASQLSSIKESSGAKLISYLAFKYDAAGQIQSRFRAPLVNSGWQHPALTATYDDDNRLLTANGINVTHDADGNMTSGPISREGGTGVPPVSSSLTYNSRNQLTYAAGVTYTYDAEGRRRTLTDAAGTTRETIDPSGKLLVRTHPNNTKTYYVYGLGLLYEANQANTTKTYHFDQVGSTLARTDDSGKVIGQAEYSAYGLTIWKQGDMATPFLYNGQAGVQTDLNGLLNMRARYYSPYLCRFLNADPSGFSGGPNWFAYADGNPISKSDPFGLSPAWQLPPQLAQDAAFTKGYVDARANPVLAGFVMGATTAAAITVGAPVVASGLVAAGMSATTASATVTAGLGITAAAGGAYTAFDTKSAIQEGDWNRVAYNVSSVAGGALVGGMGGGRYLADKVSPTPSSVPVGRGLLGDQYMHYQLGKGSLGDWFGTGPTPHSGGGSASAIASGTAIIFNNLNSHNSSKNTQKSQIK